jgi:hypothetical protein
MPKSKSNSSARVSIQVSVALHPSPAGETQPQAVAYAFTDTGHFISKAAVEKSRSVSLNVPSLSSARNVRIVVGPELDGEKEPVLSDLTRRGAQQQFVRVAPGETISPAIFEIPPQIWDCWHRFCLVEGTLLKRVITGGLPVDMPVCNAQVHIWEVESIEIVLEKAPISVIEKLRQAIVNPPPPERTGIRPFNPNPPDPPPLQSLAGRLVNLEFAQPIPTLAPVPASELLNLQVLAQTADDAAFRQALIASASSIRFWLCELMPQWVTKTLVATTTTDHCGNFRERIFLSCFAPNPNLYFTATTNFLFFPITIYDPTPVYCYTYWGYQCGTNVTLYTGSPYAPCCSPCPQVNAPPNYVLFRAIGGIPLSQIYGDSNTLVVTPGNRGLAASGVTPGEDSPFGGLLLPRVEFDSSLLELGLASYYKISYQSATSGGWQELRGDIDRHYNHFVGTQLVTTQYNLGPKIVGTTPGFFAIPPALPPAGDWAFPDPASDLANAQFPTDALPSPVPGGTYGMYQLKLDLYDAAGNQVNIAAKGITYYVPTGVESDGTVDTVDASTLGLVSGNSLIINVYVDNRPTVAQLPGVSTPVDSTATDPCGILHYSAPGDNVEIDYVAYQPGNFLDWGLSVVRGITGSVASDSGNTSAGSPGVPVGFDNTVSSLMGTCAQAAFAVSLGCYSRATTGWGRISAYDTNATIGFALITPCQPHHHPNG